MKRIHPQRTVFLFLLFAFCSQAFAQTDSLRTRALPEVRVEAERIRERAGFKTQAIDSATVRRAPTATLGDLLAWNAPVNVRQYGAGGLQTASLRGAGASHTQLYWNGIRLNSPMLGQADLSLFPVAMAEEVSLRFGGASLLEGTGGFGGSLQFDDRTRWRNGLSARLAQTVGSFGRYQAAAQTQYGDGLWQGTTRFVYREVENDFPFENSAQAGSPRQRNPNAAQKQYGASQGLRFRIGGRSQIGLRGWWQASERELPPSMLSPDDRARQQDESLRLMADWERAAPGFTVDLKAAYVGERLRYIEPDVSLDTESRTRSFHANGKAQIRLNERFFIQTGFYLERNQAFSDNFDGSPTRLAIDGFGGLTYESERLELNALLRQQWLDGQAQDALPSLGGSYALVDEAEHALRLSGNGSRNFRAPTLNELHWFPTGDPDLRNERGWTAEAALSYRWRPSKTWQLEAEATAFGMWIDDWIVWVPGVNNLWRPENRRRVVSKGLETSFKIAYRHLDWQADLQLAFARVRAENRASIRENDASVGRQLIYQPERNGQGRLRLAYRESYLVVASTAASRRFISSENALYLPDYWLFDLLGGHRFTFSKHRLDVLARVNNLFDYHYQSIAFRPMPGRHYELTLVYSWGE